MVTIQSVYKLKSMGIFPNLEHNTEVPFFYDHNLIYGFNGSGKTTLSRVFRSIELGSYCKHLPENGEFQVKLSNGDIINQDTKTHAIEGKLLVFNEDFIEDNLQWKESKASPVFYIGEEQAKLADLVDKLNKHYGKRIATKNSYETAKKQAALNLSTFKTLKAGLISEELNMGRKYISTHLDNDYRNVDLSLFKIIEEGERIKLKETINKTKPNDDLQILAKAETLVGDFIDRLIKACNTDVVNSAIDDFKDHQSMIVWLKSGFNYHSQHNLAECLFCGGDLTPTRLAYLKNALSDALDNAINGINDLSKELPIHLDSVEKLTSFFPERASFYDELQEPYSQMKEKVEMIKALFKSQLSLAAEIIVEKQKAPHIALDTSTSFKKLDIDNAISDMDSLIIKINDLIQRHNDKNANFNTAQQQAKNDLKAHHMIEAKVEYERLNKASEKASNEHSIRENLALALGNRITVLRGRIRSHGPAAPAINKLLAAYLGHDELTLDPLTEGYKICRKGKVVQGTLSEGEKTALALCYFISKIEENGRKKKDLVVVLDDPISSLDTKALNYSFNLIKRCFSQVGQLILLTHNVNFMNEAKKWLKARSKSTPPTASLIFIETLKSPKTSDRWSKLTTFPTLLREYDSEYHYLFSKVYQHTTNPEKHREYGYILPNVFRKVLELFLTFKWPGTEPLQSKLENLNVEKLGLDAIQLKALERLAELESHGDNLEDLLSFSSMTVEETDQCADALMQFMQKADEKHFERMVKLST